MYEKEWLPHALAIGISYNDFWNMNPHIIKLIGIGYKNKIQTMDNLMWTWFGNYALSAVSVAVEHNLAGRKAKSKYIEEPVLQSIQEQSEQFSEEELQRQREQFVLKLRMMKANFELSHRSDSGS